MDGDIRLIGGSYPWEGRVEFYSSGTWGTITDSDWTSDDAQAVCRKMGYFKPGEIELETSLVPRLHLPMEPGNEAIGNGQR